MFEGQILIAVYGKRIFVLVYSSQDCLFFSFLFFFAVFIFGCSGSSLLCADSERGLLIRGGIS